MRDLLELGAVPAAVRWRIAEASEERLLLRSGYLIEAERLEGVCR